MRKLVYTMSKNGFEVMSTVSYSVAESMKNKGYTYSTKLVEITEKMPKRARELAEKRFEKRGWK